MSRLQLWQLFSVGKIFLLLLLAWILVLVLGTPIRGFDGEDRFVENQRDDVALRGALKKIGLSWDFVLKCKINIKKIPFGESHLSGRRGQAGWDIITTMVEFFFEGSP